MVCSVASSDAEHTMQQGKVAQRTSIDAKGEQGYDDEVGAAAEAAPRHVASTRGSNSVQVSRLSWLSALAHHLSPTTPQSNLVRTPHVTLTPDRKHNSNGCKLLCIGPKDRRMKTA